MAAASVWIVFLVQLGKDFTQPKEQQAPAVGIYGFFRGAEGNEERQHRQHRYIVCVKRREIELVRQDVRDEAPWIRLSSEM